MGLWFVYVYNLEVTYSEVWYNLNGSYIKSGEKAQLNRSAKIIGHGYKWVSKNRPALLLLIIEDPMSCTSWFWRNLILLPCLVQGSSTRVNYIHKQLAGPAVRPTGKTAERQLQDQLIDLLIEQLIDQLGDQFKDHLREQMSSSCKTNSIQSWRVLW